ncbi:MAG: RcnB family protein, partial [Rhodospirillaceae bacterium]
MKTSMIGIVLLSLTMAGSALAASFDVGDRMPREYRGDRYAFDDWRDAHLRRPPRGGHWARVDGQYYLLAENGTVVDVVEAAPP